MCPVASEDVIERRQCRVPTINGSRDTAPCARVLTGGICKFRVATEWLLIILYRELGIVEVTLISIQSPVRLFIIVPNT
jgi:hypothetical protein